MPNLARMPLPCGVYHKPAATAAMMMTAMIKVRIGSSPFCERILTAPINLIAENLDLRLAALRFAAKKMPAGPHEHGLSTHQNRAMPMTKPMAPADLMRPELPRLLARDHPPAIGGILLGSNPDYIVLRGRRASWPGEATLMPLHRAPIGSKRCWRPLGGTNASGQRETCSNGQGHDAEIRPLLRCSCRSRKERP